MARLPARENRSRPCGRQNTCPPGLRRRSPVCLSERVLLAAVCPHFLHLKRGSPRSTKRSSRCPHGIWGGRSKRRGALFWPGGKGQKGKHHEPSTIGQRRGMPCGLLNVLLSHPFGCALCSGLTPLALAAALDTRPRGPSTPRAGTAHKPRRAFSPLACPPPLSRHVDAGLFGVCLRGRGLAVMAGAVQCGRGAVTAGINIWAAQPAQLGQAAAMSTDPRTTDQHAHTTNMQAWL